MNSTTLDPAAQAAIATLVDDAFPDRDWEEVREIEQEKAESAGATLYSPHIDFTEALAVRGSSRIVRENPLIASEGHQQNLAALTRAANQEDDLRLFVFGKVDAIKLVQVLSDRIVFSSIPTEESAEPLYFYFPMPIENESAPLKALTRVLGVPYAFTVKNPGYLNLANFSYYHEQARSAITKNSPDILALYDVAQTMTFTIESEQPESTDEPYVPPQNITAHYVHTLYVEKTRLDIGEAPAYMRAPLMASFIADFIEHEEIAPLSPNIRVCAADLSWSKHNKGRQMYRVTLDAHPLMIESETYYPGILIESSLLGVGSRDFGETTVALQLFRVVCANGMTVVLPAEQTQDILQSARRSLSDAERDLLEDYTMSTEGITLNNRVFNSKAGLSVVVKLVSSLLQLSQAISDELRRMHDERFLRSDPEAFVKEFRQLASEMKIPSPLMKNFLTEYVADVVSGDSTFVSGMDLINYLTLTGRAYETQAVALVEAKAFALTKELARRMSVRAQEVSQFEQIRASLSREYRAPQ